MERYFASLSKRQTMLLLTAVTIGGAEAEAALDHLPEREADLLKHRAREMANIPRDKRIPLLVQEIKRLFTTRRKHLSAADPERLAILLSKERAALVEVVLRALPSNLAEQVRQHLPAREVAILKEVKPEILAIIRWKLEENLLRAAPTRGVFKFSDVLILQARELLTVCDRMGARALATALAALPDADREALFSSLPPDQRALAGKAAEAGKARKLNEADARTLLEAHGAFKNPSAALRSAGAQRLARACLAQSPEFAARLVERHPGELGRLLARWVKEERNRPILRGDGGRADIVEQLERLAQKGVIDRPIRLPPPPRRPPAMAEPGGLPGGKLLPPSPRPHLSPERRSGVAPPLRSSRSGGPESLRRRDPIAEREARRAGLRSAGEVPNRRVDPIAERERRRAGAGEVLVPRPPGRSAGPGAKPEVTNPRILRDGRPLTRPQTRAVTDPAERPIALPPLQSPPRRKGPVPGGTVVGRPRASGSRQGVIKGPDRGPKGGSG